MSDYIVKVIPTDPLAFISLTDADLILDWLKEEIAADPIEFKCTEKPQFIDCGGSLEQIFCPICGLHLSFDWWQEQMDIHYIDQGFMTFLVETPCCHKNTSLNALDYYFPCGFARFEFDIWNPKEKINDSFLEEFRGKSGFEARLIYSRI